MKLVKYSRYCTLTLLTLGSVWQANYANAADTQSAKEGRRIFFMTR